METISIWGFFTTLIICVVVVIYAVYEIKSARRRSAAKVNKLQGEYNRLLINAGGATLVKMFGFKKAGVPINMCMVKLNGNLVEILKENVHEQIVSNEAVIEVRHNIDGMNRNRWWIKVSTLNLILGDYREGKDCTVLYDNGAVDTIDPYDKEEIQHIQNKMI